jgi:hypothetical protein
VTTRTLRLLIASEAVLFSALACNVAGADEGAANQVNEQPRAAAEGDSTKRAIDRTWLYVDDAQVAQPGVLVATTSVSYTNVANSPSRIVDPDEAPTGCASPCNSYNALAGNTGVPGAMLALGAEYGILPRLSGTATAQIGLGGSDSVPSPNVGALVGFRVQLLPSSFQHFHIALSGGYLREAWQGPIHVDGGDTGDTWKPGSPNGDNGAYLQAAISGDIGDLRLAGTVHGEHVFVDGRDPVDVMVQVGASYAVYRTFRLGFEYVGQDLEETFNQGAEGGARHMLGPIASLQLWDNRFTVVGGPAFGLTAQSPDVIGRLAASYAF